MFIRIARYLLVSIILAVSTTGGSAYAAGSRADTGQVQAQLLTSVNAVHPGEEIFVGIHQKIIPHWHTYWSNPGDSGIATTIAWDLPKGAAAGEILWPRPGRFKLGPVVNYGYADEVTLLTAIKAPLNARPGGYFPINATVDWLVCREECIPQQVELRINLLVVPTGQPGGKGSTLIEKAKATLPTPIPWPVRAEQSQTHLQLHIEAPELASSEIEELWFYPTQWGPIAQSTLQTHRSDNTGVVMTLPSGDAPLAPGDSLEGVLVVKTSTSGITHAKGYQIKTPVGTITARAPETNNPGFLMAMAMALLGGIILNLMPCVFPVLSIKALSILNQAHVSPWQVRMQGLAYTLGVLSSFVALGALLLAVKATGADVGWGFQFQSPVFVLSIAYLMFAVGLNLSGVFSVGNPMANAGASLAGKSGYAGSFFTGTLATVVATPCTAPFMGVALGYAIAQPPAVLMAICLSLGLGLALPFMLLSVWPELRRRLPRPGPWMEHLKQFLAFPMYASAVWLVWVLAQQAGLNALVVALGGMGLIAFAAWLHDRTRSCSARIRLGTAGLAVLIMLAVVIGGASAIDGSPVQGMATAAAREQEWEPYSPGRLQTLRAEGKPVFLNFTAAWCISCLVNERVTLSTDTVKGAMKKSGIAYLKGDWTNRDSQINEMLAEFGHSGVPLYVFYPAGHGTEPRILPQILTPEIVINAIASNAVATFKP